MIKACILDMDGVVVDTEIIHMEAFRRFLKEKKVEFSEEFIQSLVGYSIQDNIYKIKQDLFKGKPLEISEGVKQRNDIYLKLLSSEKLVGCFF